MDGITIESHIFLQWLTHPISLLLLFLLPLIYLLFLTQSHHKQSPNHPPSPQTLPIIGNLHQLGNLPHQSIAKLSQKYGPIMLLQLGKIPTLIISSPEMAKQVTKDHDLTCCSRPTSYGIRKLSYNSSDVTFGPYGDYWRQMRKLFVVELFALKKVQSYSPIRYSEMTKLVNSIGHMEGKTVNLSDKVFDLTNALISRVAFGKDYKGENEFNCNFKDFMDECMVVLNSFWVSDFFPGLGIGWFIDVCMGRMKKLDECFARLDGFFERVVDEHGGSSGREKSEQEDIVDILLRLSKDENGPVQLSRDNIKALLLDIYLGAVDTTSLTIVWAMSEIVKKPRVMKKVQAEIRSVVGRQPNVSETDLEKLLYLKMVVKETLRLHPPGPLLLPHETMGHCMIGGYDVYPKTRVLIATWAMGRDPNVWENPEEFFPERFENDSNDYYRGANYKFLPFGSGRRMCPGVNMGLITVEYTLANLLHCFDWMMPQGMAIEDISLEEENGITVHKKIPLQLVPVKYNWEEYHRN